ncbi:MAG: WG repeat-containing protein [Bacilli bacterium]|nr:WG repeat-containing protein [Bacilli bacterium]MBO6194942.1 WG repeat-containing protein [Bacilli bacterium]
MDDKDIILLDDDEDFEEVAPSNTKKEEVIEEILPDNTPDLSNQTIFETNNDQTIFSEETTKPTNDLASQTIFSEGSAPVLDVKPPKAKKINNIKEFFIANSKALPVLAFLFVSGLGVYIFINNVKADIINLIKIEEKEKIGYINNEGNVVVKPKYIYGSDYYKGYAIVKNYNNLYGVIDGKGDSEIAFGNIFSANLYGNRYIVSKFTNDGLKMGLLDSNLKEVTRCVYDNISYSKSGIFMYTKGDVMGILNNDGKEIYSYKVDEIDDKNISVEVSNLTDKNESPLYAKIKVNSSSTIINIKTGKEVYKYTLDDIRVLDNNVFYVRNKNDNNKYFVIKDDKIAYETNEYLRLRVEDISSDIAIAIKDNASIDYINLLTREKINQAGEIKYTYSDGVVLQEIYNFSTNKNEFSVITPKKTLGTFSDLKPVDDTYVNGYMKVITENEKYAFIDKKGDFINKEEYDTATDFNENGFAIVSNDNMYGVIDTNGREVLKMKYDEIKFLDDTLFSNVEKKTNQKLFIFKENEKYGIISANGKIAVKPIYNNFKTITTKYPIIKADYDSETILVNLETYKDLSIDVNKNTQIYEDYIISNADYYNYDGQLIYTIGG